MFSATLKSLALAGALSLLSAGSVHAQSWYTVEKDATQFTALSGDMIVPSVPPSGGTPYVWPGLQSGNGVLQAVLDGRSGTWWIGDGFYGTPSLAWGNGFNVSPGDTVHFAFSSSGDVWTCTLSSGSQSASTTLDITGSTMNRAIFAVELYDVEFSFGPVVYENIEITATTAASSWCGSTGELGSYTYTVTGVSTSGNTCSIAKIQQDSAV